MTTLPVRNESIYDHPRYYDLVFGADCAAEMRFIEACGGAFLKGSKKRLFEPACGTGRLIYRLAKKGFLADGLDLNPKAVAYCNARLEKAGMKNRAFVADMTDFSVKRPYDLAFNTINSFRHVLTHQGAVGHLQSMHGAIRSGGVYLLGIHLTPTEVTPTDHESWSAQRGHLSISTWMWPVSKDKKTRIEKFGIRFDIHTPTERFRINDCLVLRSYTPKQVERLVDDAGGWKIEATYDFRYRLDCPIEVDGSTEDVVYVLRRQ
jgi:SAM-dependent methyltransferase